MSRPPLSLEERILLLERLAQPPRGLPHHNDMMAAVRAIDCEAWRFKVRDKAEISVRDGYTHIILSILPVEAVGAYQGGSAILLRKEAELLLEKLTEALSRPGPKPDER